MIYLDNAATTLHKPPQVTEAIVNALQSMGNSSRGTHAGSMTASHTVYDTRVKLAKLFGCPRADRVAFTANITEALNIAICGLIGKGDHVITTDCEHNSVLRPLYRLADEQGVELSFVSADRQGNLDYNAFDRLMQPNTRAIVCTHASNLTGNLTDLARVSAVAKAHNALLIVDAAQTAGAYPIDMTALGIDVLCFTGHKGLMGPQGTGGLCVGEGLTLRHWKVGGSGVQSYSRTHPTQMPTCLEAGTLNGHGIAGLSAAVDFINDVGVSAIHEREMALMYRFYRGIKDVPSVTVYGDFSRDRTAIVTLNIGDYESGAVSDALSEEYGIATRPGAHCAPRMHQALGTEQQGAVRFSFSWFNTEEEVDTAIGAVRELAQE
ncbi:MAG: aminotransferase class V-fold PLP-dependent enzyme [Eubacteriales bacterium]|nr:aminotransferase class V-fold PLP-dependent enzyme [Eubacteriales bacterium]